MVGYQRAKDSNRLEAQNMYIKSSWLYTTYVICVFILFVDSMFPWYMWNNPGRYISLVLTFVVTISLKFNKPHYFLITKRHVIWAIFLFLSLIWITIHQDGNLFVALLRFIIWTCLLILKTEYKRDILRFITKWFACLLVFSLSTYILFLLGIILVSPVFSMFNTDQYMFWNYYTFVISVNEVDFFRFKSIFLEPGHLTMGLVPLIMANRFDLKNKYVMLLLVVELFTFSLAGYITLFVGYLLFNFSYSRLKYLLVGIFVFSGIIWILENNGYSEMLDRLIWRRLEYSDGDLAGNNRVTSSFETVYQTVINSSNKWVGDASIDITAYGGISGYKKLIVQNGIIGLLLAFGMYIYHLLSYRKYDLMVFTLILIMLLFQNAYPFWNCVVIMYILGVDNLKFKYQ